MNFENPQPVSGAAVAWAITRRELIRFARQPARIAAAVGTPVLLWLLMSGGFAGSFRPVALGDASYATFLLPGAMTLVAVFAAIFSSISVIEDRNEGWLQAAMVSPAPRWAIALGKVLGSSVVAFAQAAVLMVALPFMHIEPGLTAITASIAALAVTTFAMTSLGFLFAWRSETTAAFHAVMNIVFMPMWLLSGAFFPPAAENGHVGVLGWLMRVNPLTWCTQAIREPMMVGHPTAASNWWLCAATLFALATFAADVAVVNRNRTTP